LVAPTPARLELFAARDGFSQDLVALQRPCSPAAPTWAKAVELGYIRACATIGFAAFNAEIDVTRRAVTGDMFHLKIKNLRDQTAEHIADAAGPAFAESSRRLCRAHALDGMVRRIFSACDHHRRAIEATDPVKLAKIRSDFRPPDHLFQVVGAIDRQDGQSVGFGNVG
jgi:hypothetical protein